MIESIIERSGTPYFSFKDIDENKPTGSIKIRVERIHYFLKRHTEDMNRKRTAGAAIEEQMAQQKYTRHRGDDPDGRHHTCTYALIWHPRSVQRDVRRAEDNMTSVANCDARVQRFGTNDAHETVRLIKRSLWRAPDTP